jgi:hypothetical protein
MAGLLDYITEAAKAQYAKGAPYRNALGGLLSGDMTALQELNKPSPVMPNEALDVAMTFAPMGITKAVGGKFPLTDFEVLQLTAQRNATLPIAEGGLGLPASNTAIDRAKALGFDINTPVYHGTNADIKAMNVKGKGKTSGAGAFVTDNPLVSETYISASGEGNILPLLIKKDNLLNVNARGRNWADIWTDQLAAKSGKQKYSLDDLGLDRYSATTTDELGMIANELGKKGVEIKNVKDLGPNSHIFRAKEYLLNKYGIVPDETWSNVTGNQFVEARDFMDKLYKSQKSNITALQDPSLIRSRFAAFDPFRRNEADILAGVGVGVPVSSGLLDIENKKVPKKEKKKTK